RRWLCPSMGRLFRLISCYRDSASGWGGCRGCDGEPAVELEQDQLIALQAGLAQPRGHAPREVGGEVIVEARADQQVGVARVVMIEPAHQDAPGVGPALRIEVLEGLGAVRGRPVARWAAGDGDEIQPAEVESEALVDLVEDAE